MIDLHIHAMTRMTKADVVRMLLCRTKAFKARRLRSICEFVNKVNTLCERKYSSASSHGVDPGQSYSAAYLGSDAMAFKTFAVVEAGLTVKFGFNCNFR